MRSEPVVTVTCDYCERETIEVGLTTIAGGYDERHMDADIKRQGWTVHGTKDMCEACQGHGTLMLDL